MWFNPYFTMHFVKYMEYIDLLLQVKTRWYLSYFFCERQTTKIIDIRIYLFLCAIVQRWSKMVQCGILKRTYTAGVHSANNILRAFLSRSFTSRRPERSWDFGKMWKLRRPILTAMWHLKQLSTKSHMEENELGRHQVTSRGHGCVKWKEAASFD